MVAIKTIQQIQSGEFQTKFRAGGYYHGVKVTVEGNRLLFHFGYNQDLLDVVKTNFEKRKYHGYLEGDGRKLWSAPITHRNLFQLEALQGKHAPANPYDPWSQDVDYTEEILNHCLNRPVPLYPPDSGKEPSIMRHQIEMINLGLNGRWVLIAGDMGTGKTLATIILCEMLELYSSIADWWWMGPRSALVAARADFQKWQCLHLPEFMTYEGLKKKVENWVSGEKPPKLLTGDESSRCKTPTAQRSLAMLHVGNAIRDTWGWGDSAIQLLSGTPAPKSPSDWWMQMEIVCPGFLSEGNLFAFRQRLGHIVKEESTEGAGAYNKLKFWKDSEDRCSICGEMKETPAHDMSPEGRILHDSPHEFVPGVNEVAKLAKRMEGAVGVWLKEDCLDLPSKRYELVEVEPDLETLNAAKLIVETSVRAVDALTRLRTLSDGFLYEEEGTGTYEPCTGCNGRGHVFEYYEEENPYDIALPEEVDGNFRYEYEACPDNEDPATFIPSVVGQRTATFLKREIDCYICAGKGEVEKKRRIIVEVECPKVLILESLLERHEECGRLNVYAGFEGSIHRVRKEATQRGWWVVKADGKGWQTTDDQGEPLKWNSQEMIYNYQNEQAKYPRMVFLGQPGAAGMGLTLTASPSTFFYSNDFIPENRMQAEDRGHRIGMDRARGGVIIDVVHLPSDRKVIDTLKRSKNLQRMSMDGLRSYYA